MHKALLSITRAADAGFECHLNKHEGYLLDTNNGEKIPAARRGNLHMTKAWIKADGSPHFTRQGRERTGSPK